MSCENYVVFIPKLAIRSLRTSSNRSNTSSCWLRYFNDSLNKIISSCVLSSSVPLLPFICNSMHFIAFTRRASTCSWLSNVCSPMFSRTLNILIISLAPGPGAVSPWIIPWYNFDHSSSSSKFIANENYRAFPRSSKGTFSWERSHLRPSSNSLKNDKCSLTCSSLIGI